MKTKTSGLGYDPKSLKRDIDEVSKQADAAMKAADAIDPTTFEVKKAIDTAVSNEVGERPGALESFFSMKWMTGDSYTDRRLAAVERIRQEKKGVYNAAVDRALLLDELKNALDTVVGRSAWPVQVALAPDRAEVSGRLAQSRTNALEEIGKIRTMLAAAEGSAGAIQFPTERLDRIEAALKRDVEILTDVQRSPAGSAVLADAIASIAELDPHEARGPKAWNGKAFEDKTYILETEAMHLARTNQKPTVVPLSLATQSAKAGSIFQLEIASKAAGRKIDVAVHLPPGFDPTASVAHPVLIVAGGTKATSTEWLAAGDLDQQLDAAAKGSARAPITIVLQEGVSKGLAKFLAEDAPAFLATHFGADSKDVSVAAIGPHAENVVEAAAKLGSKLQAVSVHGGIDGGLDLAALARALKREGPMPKAGAASKLDVAGLKGVPVYVSGPKSEGTALLALSDRLQDLGVKHHRAVFDAGVGFGDRAEDWLAFHGKARANDTSAPSPKKNIVERLVTEQNAGVAALDKAYDQAKARVRSKIDTTLEELDAAAKAVGSAKLPASFKAFLKDDIRTKRAPHERRLEEFAKLPSLDDPHGAAEALLSLEDSVRGASAVPVRPIVEAWSKLRPAVQKRLEALTGGSPKDTSALIALLLAHPKWLAEKEPKRDSYFVDQLETRIERGFLDKGDVGQFLNDAVKDGEPWLDNFETRVAGPERWAGDKFVNTSYIMEAEPDGTPRVPLIPPSMQKQSAAEGSFFIRMIQSNALGEGVRAGVYLPPGYDPEGSERYPVLVMLPGKGGKVETWLEQGGLKEHFDAEMVDGQKMIVVVPDGNDSYYVNQERAKKGIVDMKVAQGDFGDMVMEDLLAHATRTLKGDDKRMSILGLSRGGYGALSLSLQHPGRFKSVSTHGAVLPGSIKDKKGDEFDKARVTASVPSNWETNPSDLVEGEGWNGKPPALLISVGAEDQHVLEHAVNFGGTLEEAGIKHELHVLESKGDDAADHSWTVFGPTLREAIGFHQSAHAKGRQAKAKIPSGFDRTTDYAGVIERMAEKKKKDAEAKHTSFRTKFPWED